jgi:uncharacterized protein
MALWDKITSTGNVEDRRGDAVSAITGLGSVGAVVLLGIMLFTGNGTTSDVLNILEQLQTTGTQNTQTSQGKFVDTKNYLSFSEKIIGSNNQVWTQEFAKTGDKYTAPKLVLFRQRTPSACGGADSASGPHYCPSDKTIYLDETFFQELTSKLGAKGGDVAEAYVMAHEVGHHIQKLQGTFAKFNTQDNKTSVKVELQADCFAGFWAGNLKSQGIISENEIDQAIDAASSVGDDRIQKSTTGTVNPETWTHGSSAQRKQWFLTGYRADSSSVCDTI